MAEYETHEHDVLVIGAGGAGLRAAIESSAPGREHGADLQVAPRQGPHGDGRGRHRGRDGQRLARGQLEGPLPRHDAGREAPQQLADGPAPRPGGAGPGAGAGGVGRALRPDEGRPHPPARLRRAPLRAAGPRRRPDRAGDDPHPPAARGAQGDHGLHGVHAAEPPQGRRPGVRAPSATGARSGKFVLFKAKAVVLATGGIGKAWEFTSNSWEYTGDGVAMALEAGADLIDMECYQFHPTGMVWPHSVRGILVTEGVRGDGGVLRNSTGQPLHVRLHPRVLQEGDGGLGGRGGPLVRPTRRTTAARPSCCRATRWRGRSTPR